MNFATQIIIYRRYYMYVVTYYATLWYNHSPKIAEE